MREWCARAEGLGALDADARAGLDALDVQVLPAGTVLFRPGESARGFVIVLGGRIEVFLTGPTGREIMLYSVEPGGSCVQSTLGLLGGEDYTGEAVTAQETEAVLVPRTAFLALMDRSASFRGYVFAAFARRMQGMMHVIERVAFQRVESRLAAALLAFAPDIRVEITHQALATRIGTAREVVSRRLVAMEAQGLVATERGAVRLVDIPRLRLLAEAAD